MDRRDIKHTQELIDSNLVKDAMTWYTKLYYSRELLKEALEFMNLVPNNKYGNNYSICSKIEDFLKK